MAQNKSSTTISDLSNPREKDAIEELKVLIPQLTDPEKSIAINDHPLTKIPQKTTKKAIAKKQILMIVSDGKFYSTRGLATKIPPHIANQAMILRYLKELEMTKDVLQTSFLWSIN